MLVGMDMGKEFLQGDGWKSPTSPLHWREELLVEPLPSWKQGFGSSNPTWHWECPRCFMVPAFVRFGALEVLSSSELPVDLLPSWKQGLGQDLGLQTPPGSGNVPGSLTSLLL